MDAPVRRRKSGRRRRDRPAKGIDCVSMALLRRDLFRDWRELIVEKKKLVPFSGYIEAPTKKRCRVIGASQLQVQRKS